MTHDPDHRTEHGSDKREWREGPVTADVVSLADYRQPEVEPHAAGKARCLECRREWQAVAPVGVTRLECDGCGTQKGVWVGAMGPAEGELVWRCSCDNDLFTLQPTGAPMCARCGLRATSWADG